MLVTTPACCNDVFLWLISLGIDADKIQQKEPRVMTRNLSDVQSTLTALQQGLQLEDELVPVFVKRHFHSLVYTAEHVMQTFFVVAELLAMPVASPEVQQVLEL